MSCDMTALLGLLLTYLLVRAAEVRRAPCRAARRRAAGMTKEMIISSSAHETRVAILEDDQVAEIFIERERSARRRRQPLQGPGLESAARHAVGVR